MDDGDHLPSVPETRHKMNQRMDHGEPRRKSGRMRRDRKAVKVLKEKAAVNLSKEKSALPVTKDKNTLKAMVMNDKNLPIHPIDRKTIKILKRPKSDPTGEKLLKLKQPSVVLEKVKQKNNVHIVENWTQTANFLSQDKGISLLKTPSGIKEITITPKKPKRKKLRLMDWRKFHRLKVIYDFLDELEKDYPAICTVIIIGKTVEGRDIKMLKISNSNATNSSVWLDGCIHPREWISTAVVTYIADVVVKNFTALSNAITNKDWHIVPVLNPDGYEYTHTRDRMWRKNRAQYGGQCVGVDLNRNFSYGWGNNGEEGSSEEPHSLFYRGPAPFSEPEAVAVRDAILGSSSSFKVFLSFHSYFELIIFPWGYKQDPCPNYLRLLEAGTAMARAIYDSTGYTYKVGSTKDMTYFASGTSTDWSYGIAKIPYSYMIELRSKKYRFRLPKDQIMDTCIENWSAVKSLMDYVDEH